VIVDRQAYLQGITLHGSRRTGRTRNVLELDVYRRIPNVKGRRLQTGPEIVPLTYTFEHVLPHHCGAPKTL